MAEPLLLNKMGSNEFISFYQRLLGGERTNRFIDLSFLRPWARYLLSEEDSAALIKPVTAAEVKMAFFDVEEDKSPGPMERLRPRRSIGDNILLAQELFTGYNQQHLPPRCALKVDLRKAYDTVEWDFMLATLHLFRARGLRQGDPMSPYLFVLVMEVLHLILRQLIDQDGGFGYHWRCAKTLFISACFADDLLLFCKAEVPSVLSFSRGFRDCKPLLQRVDERIKGWEGINLSFAGRGHSGGGYASVAWSQVCRPKEEGGLGIRDVLALNRADAIMANHHSRPDFHLG
ncbi:UNVERIFIED_CONTAM: hypothetical protein Slati_1378000 [Sesamum latifolium]|uniref:Reverse transcriptase domain-containing protein n=1 Tax=Sesamum latifolium TaxID=2727402 RepID=A0AAW2XJD3_9LAMI